MSFDDICDQYDIDKERFSRDYYNQPLKTGENIIYDDLYYAFIEKNLSLIECANLFNTSMYRLRHSLYLVNIKKDPTLQQVNRERFCIKKHGVINPSCLDDVKEKRIKTNIERYGYKNSAMNPEIKAKTLRTMNERYGGNSPSASKEVVDKIKKTNLERYGEEWSWKKDEYKEKRKNVWIKKYGVDNPLKDKNVREKCRNTLKEKYGKDTIGRFGTEEHDRVILERYGVKHISQNKEIQEKIKKTNLDKYGVTCVLSTPENREKSKQSIIDKYGVSCTFKVPEIAQKAQKGRAKWRQSEEYEEKRKEMTIHGWETRKKNGTCNTSKDEEYIFQLLSSKFDNVKRNHRTKVYPFHCDFYIPLIDTYIEYQGFWTHGNEPFVGTDEQNKRVEWLKEKTNELNYKNKSKTMYKIAIDVWTVRDPLKRETARKNNLNWMEFFTMDEFMAWYDSLN